MYAAALILAAMLPSAGGKLVIAGMPITGSATHYHAYVKHLTVSPTNRQHAAFKGTDVAAIQALECPLRRQIVVAMNNNRAESFAFATLQKARENVDMRVAAVHLMLRIQRGPSSGVDFGYAHGSVPDAADPAHWVRTDRYAHRSRPNVTAAQAIDGLVSHRYRGECLGTLQIVALYSARKALGAARFNRLHPNGLDIGGPRAAAPMKHFTDAASLSPRDMVPGDWVYMKNKDDYGTGLRPGRKPGLWFGENAVYLGRFDIAPDGSARFGAGATQRFSGLGLYARSEAELRASLKKGYLSDMRPAFTLHTHTITDADIRWFRVVRLVTGA